MRIAYVINSLEGGGTTAPLPALFEVMRKHGADVKLFALAMKNGLGLAPVEKAGVEHEVCHPERSHRATLRWLEEQIEAWSPDILWTSLSRATLLGQIVGQRQRLPVVSWQHNLYLKRANAFLLRRRRRLTALWVADSAVVADMAVERLRIDPAKIVTWPIFRADPVTKAAPRTSPLLRLGSLGRLHPAKGYDLLIDAMAKIETPAMPGYRVEIAGIGAEREALVKRAADARVSHRLDFVGQRQADDFLAGLDLYLQPSRREGFGIAAHEAMAAGLPILAADTGEMANSIRKSGGGSLFPVGDVDALAATLANMLETCDQWPAVGKKARTFCQTHYSADAFAAHGGTVMERVKTLL